MKINEAGMNALILGMPLGGVFAHAAPSTLAAEPPSSTPDAQIQSAQAHPSNNPTRPVLWLAVGICVATAAWMIAQGEHLVNPVPKVTKLSEQPQKVERAEVPALEPLKPLPPLTVGWTEFPAADAAQNGLAPTHSPAAENRKRVAETRPVQKKPIAAAAQPSKAHVAPDPAMPAAAIPKEARAPAAALVPEKIDGAALGIISASNDKLVMSVDGSFRIFRPGERLPFNEVLVSVRNGRITTDKRAIELAQQP